jgi:hypothetical protein
MSLTNPETSRIKGKQRETKHSNYRSYSAFYAASTKSVPTIGPVQEKKH